MLLCGPALQQHLGMNVETQLALHVPGTMAVSLLPVDILHLVLQLSYLLRLRSCSLARTLSEICAQTPACHTFNRNTTAAVLTCSMPA